MNGSKAPALFRYDDQTAVRVVTVDGEPWFVLADLTKALGIARFNTDRLDEGCTAKGIGKLHELMGGSEPIRFITGEASA